MISGKAGTLANTLKLPSVGAKVYFVGDAGDVRAAIDDAVRQGLPVMPLGEGSNVVLPATLNRAILYATDQSLTVLDVQTDYALLRVGAAYSWHRLVLDTVDDGFFGLENMALIPGLVGAAPVQNIGAYGRELSEFVVAVHGVDLKTGIEQSLAAPECEFAYRHSVFKARLRDRFMITAVDLRLSRVGNVQAAYPALAAELAQRGGELTPAAVLDAVVAIRSRKLPNPEIAPNVGSFFKNPIVDASRAHRLLSKHSSLPTYAQADGRVKLSAAWLIEACGLRGYGNEAVGVSDQHALVLVNRGGAQQSQVLALGAHIRHAVSEKFDVSLEIEPRVYRDD